VTAFTSATVTALIQLIRKARAQGIALVIVFNAEKKWQALTFDALRSFELPDGLLRIRARLDS
jgi:alpha-D-ribose 1-methylphosphonate 5-triphosphate synthase subunit PhnL